MRDINDPALLFGGDVDGWRNATETFNVTLELVRRGCTEEQIGKIRGGNLLRVREGVERVAAASSATLRQARKLFARAVAVAVRKAISFVLSCEPMTCPD